MKVGFPAFSTDSGCQLSSWPVSEKVIKGLLPNEISLIFLQSCQSLKALF